MSSQSGIMEASLVFYNPRTKPEINLLADKKKQSLAVVGFLQVFLEILQRALCRRIQRQVADFWLFHRSWRRESLQLEVCQQWMIRMLTSNCKANSRWYVTFSLFSRTEIITWSGVTRYGDINVLSPANKDDCGLTNWDLSWILFVKWMQVQDENNVVAKRRSKDTWSWNRQFFLTS